MITEDFLAAGEDMDAYVKDNRLVIFNVNESYADNGGFDPDKTVETWLANIKRNDQNIHARKMEIIRTLSQRIAHDFNNLLLPITGMAELLMEELPENSEMYENAHEILKAGQKGSILVKEIMSLGSRTDV